MSHALLLKAALGGIVLIGVLAALLTVQLQRQERLAARLRQVRQHDGAGPGAAARPRHGHLFRRMLANLGQAVAQSGLLPGRTIAELEHTLRAAGLRGGQGLGLFIGSKIILLVAAPGIALLVLRGMALQPLTRTALIVGCAVAGLLGPDFTVRFIRKRHLRRVERGLPDALDMMVICCEAGLALEPGIARVGSEMRGSNPAISEELLLVAQQLRINPDSRAALLEMGARTGLEGLKRLGATLTQTMQYGTPLSQALRGLSAELRQEMLTRFEARAARLPVLLTLPMIVFILPCVFIIVGGPAMLQLFKTLSRH